MAKVEIDDYPFYGSLLNISYAPQYETINDTIDKLQERKKEYEDRMGINENEQIYKDIQINLKEVLVIFNF